MRIVRLAVVLGCLAQVHLACGCPDGRVPSVIEMTLSSPLGDGTYKVEVCVDTTCQVFDVTQGSGTSPDGQVSVSEASSDTLRYTSWNAISPGTHDVGVDVSTETGSLAFFDGSVEFRKIDRCHAGDAQAAIELVASQ